MTDQENAPFWFVWNPCGRNPSYKHPTEESAMQEAKRLAKEYAGEYGCGTFIVLQSVAAFKMQRVNLAPPMDDVPF